MSTIIAISNQKGGVSKTVTSFNLGACLAINHEKKVLLADIDPQANLSEYLGYEPDGKPTMTQLIMTACMGNAVSAEIVKTAVRYSERSKTDYIPADINLASTESLLRESADENGNVINADIICILDGKKDAANKGQTVKISHDIFSKYFSPDMKKKEINETVEKALKMYFANGRD